MKIKEQKINDFLESVSAKTSTPGGGAVAALSGAMAAALIEMVCNLTIGKKGYEKMEKDIKILRYKAIKTKKGFLKSADRDVEAFNKVMEAYKIPKTDKSRMSKIQRALKYATEVPTQTAKLAVEIEKLAKRVAKIGNKNAISDAKTAGHLAKAAYSSAMENVKINKDTLARLK